MGNQHLGFKVEKIAVEIRMKILAESANKEK